MNIKHPKLQAVMSREARQLRDNVYDTCIKYFAHGSMTETAEYEKAIIDTYNPIVWERPILLAHDQVIFDSFLRITSAKYKEQQDHSRETRGNKAGSRRKDIDWLLTATTFPDDLWLPHVPEQDKRKGNVSPEAIYKVRDQFGPMYELFTKWLIVDFSHKVLFGIFDASMRYSLSLVSDCMEMVPELRNRSYEYLMVIVEKEMIIRQAEMMETKDLLDRSKMVLKAIVDLANDKSKIDWDSIDKDIKMDQENQEAFEKVKPT
jgi:hypothetical protein